MGSKRLKGSAMVLILAVLALIFLVGAALLIVAGFHRRATVDAAQGRDLQQVQEALNHNVLRQLREDVVGADGIPYNGR